MSPCRVAGCTKFAPQGQPACARHWSRLPWPVRQRVYAAAASVRQAEGVSRRLAMDSYVAAQIAAVRAVRAVGLPG